LLTAVGGGLLGGVAMLLGALVAFRVRIAAPTLGRIMAFAAGTLVCAVTLELTAEAFDESGGLPFALGLTAGALSFYAGQQAIERRFEERPGGIGVAIVLGSVLDGIPESMSIGLTAATGEHASLALVVSVFLSNVPEGVVPTPELEAAGWSRRRIVTMWTLVALACGASAIFGYAVLGAVPDSLDAFVLAYAAGTILTMLAITLFPEAVARAGPPVGLWVVLGYAMAAFLVSTTN
jgi:ZIP family zinc transporter